MTQGLGIVERFGAVVGDLMEKNPTAANKLLLTGFKAKRFQTRRLPSQALLPYGRTATRVTLEGVVSALEAPDEALLTSIFMPMEPFLAMGLKPLVAEALSDFVSGACAEKGFVRAAESRGVPETYCSYHKVLLGAQILGTLGAPRMVANCSVACDANSTTFRMVAKEAGCPQAYIDVPYAYDDDACAYVADQLRDAARMAEGAYGRKLNEDELKAFVARGQQTLAAYAAALPARGNHPLHNDMTVEMMQALCVHLSLGTEDALAMTEQLEHDLTDAPRYDGLRIVWMHSMPYFSDALVPLVNQDHASARAQIVACDMCYDQALIGSSAEKGSAAPAWDHGPDEPWEAMAERLLKNSFNGPASRRVERVAELVRATDADGVVCFCHWGCKETMGASQLAKRELEAAGVPVLVLDGDGCDRANNPEGQIATRMGAFLEMLEARRAS